jgi:hypothetical protein
MNFINAQRDGMAFWLFSLRRHYPESGAHKNQFMLGIISAVFFKKNKAPLL